MRQPQDWTEDDLLALISEQVTESLTLDYKASASLQRTDGRKGELSKDVSAFANSAGGILVYGIKEDGHVPTDIDDGLDPTDISKEWIEQVINSRISRRIDGVHIQQIWLTGARAGRVAYVVSVPSSPRAPHMASDHRYYKRFNFESAPMEEYEARDVSRRLVAPDVRFNATVVNERPTTGSNVLIQLDTYVENFSPAAAGFALVTFHVTSRNFPTTEGIDAAGETVLEHEGIAHPVHSYKLEWRGSTRLPLMQGARYHVARVSLSVADSVGPAHLFWEVLAPSADANRGAYRLSKHNTCFLIADAAGAWALSWAAHWRI